MSWLLGAGMGFLRGGPLGAVIGGTIQHVFTKKILKKINQGLPGVVDKSLFVTCLVVVLTRIAMTKGTPSSGQIHVIHKFFRKNLHYEIEDLRYIDKVIEETQRINPELPPFVEQYKKASQRNYNLLLLALCYQVALIDDSLMDETQRLIDQVAQKLGISYSDHDRIRKKYSLGAAKNPYTILGLTYSAKPEEIKKAYRQKAAQFHPDRVAHLGDDKGEEAHIRFLEIQAAYEELEQIHHL